MRDGIDFDRLENLGDDLVPQVEVRAYLGQSWSTPRLFLFEQGSSYGGTLVDHGNSLFLRVPG